MKYIKHQDYMKNKDIRTDLVYGISDRFRERRKDHTLRMDDSKNPTMVYNYTTKENAS